MGEQTEQTTAEKSPLDALKIRAWDAYVEFNDTMRDNDYGGFVPEDKIKKVTDAWKDAERKALEAIASPAREARLKAYRRRQRKVLRGTGFTRRGDVYTLKIKPGANINKVKA